MRGHETNGFWGLVKVGVSRVAKGRTGVVRQW